MFTSTAQNNDTMVISYLKTNKKNYRIQLKPDKTIINLDSGECKHITKQTISIKIDW